MHSSESSSGLFPSIEELVISLGITDSSIRERLAALQLQSADRARLLAFWQLIEPETEGIARRLYAKLRSTPQLAGMLQQESRIERLILLQHVYLQQLFCDPVDMKYARSRIRIGRVHHHIRVTPQWYLATYSHILAEFIDLIFHRSDSTEHAFALLDSLQKSVFFDISVVLDAYSYIEEDSQVRQDQPVQEGIGAERFGRSRSGSESEPSPKSGQSTGGMTRIRISDAATATRAEFIGLKSGVKEELNSIRHAVESSLESVLSRFYDYVRTFPPLAIIVPESQVSRLIRQVSAYWREFFDGGFDDRHAASRMRIGVIHESIGLSMAWYVSGLSRQISGILSAIPGDTRALPRVLKTFFRGVLFDMTCVIDAYMEARAASLLAVRGFAQQLLAGLTSAVVVVSGQNHILFANESFLELTGIDPSMLYMMDLGSVQPPGEVISALRRKRELGLKRASCTTTWADRIFRVNFVSLSVSSETPVNSTAIVFDDVSDVVQLSENLEMDSRQYKNLADAVTAVLWEMNCETGIIHAISHPVIDLLGHRDVSLLGRPNAWQNCIAACDQSRFAVCCKALSPGSQTVCEYRMLRADGREIWVRSHLSRIEHDARLMIAAVTIDITRERQSDHLRMVALEDVASGMVNVINNALTVIHANLEMEQDSGSSGTRTPRLPSPFLNEARQAATRAANVIGQIRVFARGQFLRSRIIQANEILQSSLYSFRLQCGPLSKLETELEPKLWEIRADPDQLTLAVGHLCENAGRAMPSGGHVRLVTRNITAKSLSFSDRGFMNDWVEISIHDSGTGMPDDVRERAIEPFFTTTPDRLGLGLSMVHGFVAQSGGHLTIGSRPGAGTSVSLFFPRLNEYAAVDSANRNSESVAVVLVVDSDEYVRASTSLLVERMGHRTLVARDAETAMEIAKRNSISTLITDLPLQNGSNGMTLARHIEELCPEAGIILMTGSGSLDQLNESVPPSWVVLDKPFSRHDLAQALADAGRPRTEKGTIAPVLSRREQEVLQWVAAGKSQAEIALLLHISERTVEQHVRNAKLKLNAVNTIQAVVDAISRGEIKPPGGSV